MEEALFKVVGSFVYVQYASDGDFDYTIYDPNFNIIDGGRVENDGTYDLWNVVQEVIGRGGVVKRVDVAEYADKL